MTRKSSTVLVGVCIAAVINYTAASFAGDIMFNAGRIVVALVGGWLVVSHGRGSLWLAASVGPLVMLIDHVVLKGGYFVLAHYLWPRLVQGEGLLAAGGVLVSYAMFMPIAIFCSLVGGYAARYHRRNAEAHS